MNSEKIGMELLVTRIEVYDHAMSHINTRLQGFRAENRPFSLSNHVVGAVQPPVLKALFHCWSLSKKQEKEKTSFTLTY